MKNIKFLFTLFFVLLLFSCDEEDGEKLIQKVEEENEKEDSLLTGELNYSLYPEYTFWNSKFKISIENNNKYDTSNFKFNFNNLEIEPSEIIVDSLLIDFIFFTPENSYSDSLKITYLSRDDTLSVFTKKYDVVNSEIRIDEIQNSVLCDNTFILTGKGLRYAKYLNVYRVLIKYAGKPPINEYNFGGICKTIDDNTATFKINHQQGFYLKIVNIDSLRTNKYKYLKLVETEIIYDNYSVINIEDPKIKTSLLENNRVTLITSKWAKLKDNDKIYFDNKLIPRSEISFYPAKLDLVELSGYNRAYYYANVDGTVKFNIPNDSKSNDIRIEFECGGEIDLTPTIGNQYRMINVQIRDIKPILKINANYAFDTNSFNYFDFKYDSLTSDINYPEQYVYNRNYDNNITSSMTFNTFKINELNDDLIDFEFINRFYSGTPGNQGGNSRTIITLNYKGNYDFYEDSKYIYVEIINNNLNNSEFEYEKIVDRNLYGRTLDVEIDGVIYNENSEIKLILEKW